MIQELLGSGLISGERRINPITTNGTILHATPPPHTYSHNHHSSPSPSSAATTPTTTTSTTPAGALPATGTAPSSLNNSSAPSSSSSTAAGEHLRCPRCDSSNTKFCYYNNYNLTQPRHFCKTCRRYWTKGGALRNVPIGGGCRKNKSTSGLISSSSSSAVVSTFGKPTTTTTDKLKSLAVGFGNSSSSPSLFGASLYDLHHHQVELPSSPILWGSASPQNNSHGHHFLSLLRSSPNPNPNPSSIPTPQPASSAVKDEHPNGIIGSLFGTTSTSPTTSHLKMFEPPATTARTLAGWDTSSSVNNQQQQATLLGLNYPPIPMWTGDSNGNGYLVGSDEPLNNNNNNNNTGMQEVYQRLKASTSTSGYDVFNENNNVGSTSSCFSSAGVASSSSTVAGGGGGFSGYIWNPAAFTSSTATTTTAASWSDLPSTANNGTAYP
ncbi:unnamed protein product [Linum trigynum]|uniref:Dof zinc finger protein n=1 Tax=Linum trigynum TaxID=586398 RepID=A0AAV2E4Q0_9ROSI